ncbi:hypothetical protein [Micromonospora narathiwatensis]|uniref:Uncharacterized protein n=1 Tax=Micromonospora narathiwatensis TaxID=299146 RepID=A0A1A9ACE1_9ACTN|nr:hypothetical protein [Micromonospora narathiwatensis]SBT53868.1 hypothetical protein GA0070621_5035 [Micromonospora narathiwatensis]
MSDAYVVGDPDGLTPLQAEIRDAVARELHAQFALRADRLELADLPEVAYQITLRVDGVLSSRRPTR